MNSSISQHIINVQRINYIYILFYRYIFIYDTHDSVFVFCSGKECIEILSVDVKKGTLIKHNDVICRSSIIPPRYSNKLG